LFAKTLGLPAFPVLTLSYFFDKKTCVFLLLASNVDLVFLPAGPAVLTLFLLFQVILLEVVNKILVGELRRRGIAW